MCCVPLRSVRPSLASSTSGAMPAFASASAAGHAHAAVLALALAHEPEREVRERREIARGADRATRGDHGMDPGGEQLAQPRADLGPGAAAAGRQHLRAQEHHRAGRVPGQGRADPGAVRPHQVALQLGDLGGRDADLGQRAEPGVHAVDRGRCVAARHDAVDDRAGARHRAIGVGAGPSRAIAAGDLGDEFQGEQRVAEQDGGHEPVCTQGTEAGSRCARTCLRVAQVVSLRGFSAAARR